MANDHHSESVHVHPQDAARTAGEHHQKSFVVKERTKPTIIAQLGILGMSPCQVLASMCMRNLPSVARVGDFVFLILRVLATVLLVLFGLGMFWFGNYAGKQRVRLETACRGTDTEEWAPRTQRSMPWISLLLGFSFLAASIFVSVNPILSVVVVALPFAVRFGVRRVIDRR